MHSTLKFLSTTIFPATKIYFAARPFLFGNKQDEESDGEETSQKNMTAEQVAWGLAGISIGVIAGVLYAPEKGTKTRETIAQSTKTIYETGVTKAKEVQEVAHEEVAKVKDVFALNEDAA